MTVGIVGLGLIGGSAAKAYKANSEHRVLGYNRNPVISEYAVLSGDIDEVMDDNNIGECDFIILSLYPAATIDFMEKKAHLFKKGCLVMDFCGTKRMVCKAGFELAESTDLPLSAVTLWRVLSIRALKMPRPQCSRAPR